ncbi:putative holin-like toxin [Lutispora sp.]|nr:hypothetical protein [Clostridiaceae bacterium]
MKKTSNDTITIMLTFGMFIIALLSLIISIMSIFFKK